MRTKHVVPLVLALAGLLASPQASAAGLPAWDDDSGLVVSAEPTPAAGARAYTLTGRVYHAVDQPAQARWWLSVKDADGVEVRGFSGAGTFQPGEPMQLAALWDGRGAWGAPVKDGRYQLVLDVELRPLDASAPSPAPAVDPRDAHERAGLIRQRATGVLEVGAAVEPASPVRASATPHEPGFPFNFYFGTLHTQTAYSDGGHANTGGCQSSTTHQASDFTPAQAFDYARNTARLDFMAVTDHNHQFNDTCSGCTSAQIIQRYHDGLAASAAANADGSFVAIYGMEWGYIGNSSYPSEGHVGLFETPKLFGWETGAYEVYTDAPNYPALYTAAMQNPSPWGAFGQWNHPSNDYGLDFGSMTYTTDGDDLIHTIAVISGPATDYSTASSDTGPRYAGDNKASYTSYASIDMYNRALGAGYHVAPVADQDVHCSNYGTATRDRTVVLASALTKSAFFDALHNRRVYATSAKQAQLVFTLNAGGTTYYMGAGGIRSQGPVATSGSLTFHVSVYDPEGRTVSSIKLKDPVANNTDGSATTAATGTSSPFDVTLTPAGGKHAYYAYVTFTSGDEMWSAPIWINHAGVADTTAPTAPANLGVSVGRRSLSLAWTASTDNVGVTGYQVWRATSSAGPFSQIATTASTSYTNSGLTSGTTYWYQVKAYDAAGNVSAASNTASGTPR